MRVYLPLAEWQINAVKCFFDEFDEFGFLPCKEGTSRNSGAFLNAS